jgi:hypothetical protein
VPSSGPYADALNDLKFNAIEKWDYSSAFPTLNPDGTPYTNPVGPIFVDGWPWQLDKQLQSVSNSGQMTQPYISFFSLPFSDRDRTFGDIYQAGQGAGPLSLRLGRRVDPSFLISCWADQQLGGMDMCRKLGSHVISAVFYYRNRLATIRGLRVAHSHEALSDAAQLYRFDLTIAGRALMVTDV